jgi:hypothetical protein
MVTRKQLSVRFTNTFVPSYDVFTAEPSSRFFTGDGTAVAGENDHSHLDRSHTDESDELCSLYRITGTDSLTTICENFSINSKMKTSHNSESGVNMCM